MLAAPSGPLRVPWPSASGDAVVLRPWNAADSSQLLAAWNNPALAAGAPPPDRRSSDEALWWITGWAERIERNLALDLVIAGIGGADDDRVIGEIGLAEISTERRGAVVGYWIDADWQGRGLATAVVQTFTRWALDELDFQSIAARVEPGNEASVRVLEKAGFARSTRTVAGDDRLLFFLY